MRRLQIESKSECDYMGAFHKARVVVMRPRVLTVHDLREVQKWEFGDDGHSFTVVVVE